METASPPPSDSADPAATPAEAGGAPEDFSPALARVSGLRVLMLGWCLWLLGSWGASAMLDGPRLGGRWLMMAVMSGMMLVWPAMRLSQPRPPGRSPLAQTLGEWLCLNLVLQAVLWPLRMTTGWTLAQTGWLDGALAAWSAITGVLIAWGRQRDGAGVRGAAMGLCVALVLAEPLAEVLWPYAWGMLGYGGTGTWTMRLSPVQVVWALTSLHKPVTVEPWRAPILAAAFAAAAGTAVLGVWEAKRMRAQNAKGAQGAKGSRVERGADQ